MNGRSRPTQKQLVAIIAGGIAGAVCFVGLTMLLHRRLYDERIRRTSTYADTFILLLLWVQLSLGLVTLPFSLGHTDGSVMLQLSAWSQAIVTFRPRRGGPHPRARLPLFRASRARHDAVPASRPSRGWCTSSPHPVWYLFRSWQIVRMRGGATTRPGPVARPGTQAAE